METCYGCGRDLPGAVAGEDGAVSLCQECHEEMARDIEQDVDQGETFNP